MAQAARDKDWPRGAEFILIQPTPQGSDNLIAAGADLEEIVDQLEPKIGQNGHNGAEP